MALSGTILSNKDAQPQAYKPLLLASFQFIDGTFLYLSTLPLNIAEGGFAYFGQNYLGRIAAEDIQAIQIRSDQGIDRIPSVTIHISDADKFIFSNYEKTIGFKGATVTLTLVLYEADTGNFSSDAYPKFTGICDAPQFDQGCDVLSVSATSSNNMGKASLPPLRIQQRCINTFARNAVERKAGASDMASWQWSCGYDPDQPCTDPELAGDGRRGNTTGANLIDAYGRKISDASGNFILCDYTKDSCVQRGMYTQDSSGRKTGRFTGIQWAPVHTLTRSESYTDGKWADILSNRNDAIYGDVYPLVYGNQWVNSPKIANVLGDANSTRMEVIVCVGDVGPNGILEVVVNGVIVPFQNPKDALFTWRFVNTGSRNGAPSSDALYDSNGDPYGSLCTIEIVVYRALADSTSPPTVRVLCAGPKVKVPNTDSPADQAIWPYQPSNNPAWCLLDALIWANWRYEQIDIPTFRAAAAFANIGVNYVNLSNQTVSHPRYLCEFALTQRKQAAEVVAGVLQSFNAQLVRNNNSGLLQLYIRQTLADQQGSPVSGSNYGTPIQSVTAAGFLASGFAAYRIDESSIARVRENGPSTLRIYKRPSADSPNRVTIGFQDRDNSYAQDSISMVDADDVARAGGYQGGNEIPANLQATGISSFDQATRVANVYLGENLRGNENGDTRGTWYFDWVSTIKLEHLRVGHICLFQYQQLGLTPLAQLFAGGVPIPGILVRIIKIAPSSDFRSVSITAQWHEDVWYTDLYGQRGAPLYSNPRKHRPVRPPFPWKPNAQAPITGDSIFAPSELTFGVSPTFSVGSNGESIAELSITGVHPSNDLSSGTNAAQPPLVPLQGVTGVDLTASIVPGTYLIGVVAKDAAGYLSPMSELITVVVPVGSSTNTIGTGSVNWQAHSAGFITYAGPNSQSMCEQSTGSGTPASFTFKTLNVASYGPPDLAFDHLVFKTKRSFHGGVFGAQANAVGLGTLKFTGSTFTVNQWAGRNISMVARMAGDLSAIPVADFRVVSNTADTLTVTPDPLAAGVNVGDVFIMRTQPTTFTATTIGDALFVNSFGPTGLNVNEETGRRVRITRGTGAGQAATIVSNTSTVLTVAPPFATIPDATSQFLVEEASWQAQISGSRAHATNQTVPAVVQLLNITNYKGQQVLVVAVTADANGKESLEPFAPFRDIYVWGSGENVKTITGNYTILNGDQVLLADSTAGPFSINLPDGTINGGRILTIKKISTDSNVITILPAAGQQVEFASSSTLVNQGDSALLQGKAS